MAFCEVSFSNENNEEKRPSIHSLENTISFSKYLNQNSVPNKVGVFIISEIGDKKADRRAKMFFPEWKFDKGSYCTLLMSSNVSGYNKGFCFKGINYFTLARNLVSFSFRSKRQVANKDEYKYQERQEGDTRLVTRVSDLSKIRVHPKYNGRSDCGFDIGVLPFVKDKSNNRICKSCDSGDRLSYIGMKWHDVLLFSGKIDNIKKGMEVEVAGHLGQGQGSHETHKGKIIDITKTKLGGYLLWYKSSVKPSHSGSCILITDTRYFKVHSKKPGVNKVIVGLHTGYDAIEDLYYGTLITSKIVKWMFNL